MLQHIPRTVTVTLTLTLALAVAGCGGSAPAAVDQAGNPAVYARIAAETDCAAVQAEFELAYANHQNATAGSPAAEIETGYMIAANDREKALGCP